MSSFIVLLLNNNQIIHYWSDYLILLLSYYWIKSYSIFLLVFNCLAANEDWSRECNQQEHFHPNDQSIFVLFLTFFSKITSLSRVFWYLCLRFFLSFAKQIIRFRIYNMLTVVQCFGAFIFLDFVRRRRVLSVTLLKGVNINFTPKYFVEIWTFENCVLIISK